MIPKLVPIAIAICTVLVVMICGITFGLTRSEAGDASYRIWRQAGWTSTAISCAITLAAVYLLLHG